jgi:hypothetical protein
VSAAGVVPEEALASEVQAPEQRPLPLLHSILVAGPLLCLAQLYEPIPAQTANSSRRSLRQVLRPAVTLTLVPRRSCHIASRVGARAVSAVVAAAGPPRGGLLNYS